ncbi:hypothetical protein [Pseudoduganella violaceinigra]|uniref:hypothetical protein n=1 Tax=Pseudoduganella violaceinigra TaxID=246602 RepID=UPI00040A2685|nr:hypothetical protein [Pseudoduganella violaceinigra]
MKKSIPKSACVVLFTAGVLAACSPKFNWRDFHSADAPYTVMLPGKAATYTRPVNLDGQEVKMTMSAAEVDGTMFAVGTAELADAGKAALAVQAMKLAMVRNIGGTITKESSKNGAFEVEARGAAPNGAPMALHGRFLAKDKRVYQVVMLGNQKHFDVDTVDTFLSSFKLN